MHYCKNMEDEDKSFDLMAIENFYKESRCDKQKNCKTLNILLIKLYH